MSESISIPYYQLLNHQSKIQAGNDDYQVQPQTLLDFYQQMVLTRTFDQKAISLQRTGRLGTYASSLGQEAIGTALGNAMQANDVLVPTYREYGAQLARGVKMSSLLLYWGGDERGMAFEEGAVDCQQDMPICVPIASQTCHAVGIAYAMQLRNENRVTVCVLGDGATSKGDFYEALNAAGVWQLPLVFVIANNQWAISLPREAQSHTESLAQKAWAGGIHAEQVDGNDVLASYERFHHAIEQARQQKGPQLIEALTFRLSDHTTADDASRYRSADLVEKQWQFEPIKRLKNYLLTEQMISVQQLEVIQSQCSERVNHAVNEYLNTPAMHPSSMFDHLYAELPAVYQIQRDEIVRRTSTAPKAKGAKS